MPTNIVFYLDTLNLGALILDLLDGITNTSIDP